MSSHIFVLSANLNLFSVRSAKFSYKCIFVKIHLKSSVFKFFYSLHHITYVIPSINLSPDVQRKMSENDTVHSSHRRSIIVLCLLQMVCRFRAAQRCMCAMLAVWGIQRF